MRQALFRSDRILVLERVYLGRYRCYEPLTSGLWFNFDAEAEGIPPTASQVHGISVQGLLYEYRREICPAAERSPNAKLLRVVVLMVLFGDIGFVLQFCYDDWGFGEIDFS